MAKNYFMQGNEVIVKAALDSGANFFAGYPITPTTDILHYWEEKAEKNKKLKFVQTEDEMAAGFFTLGAVLAGRVAFTATAGPGNILMQDPMSAAEAMRMPTVAIIGQRGGPSTGTVIYSQQEVNLTTHGGNGEGLRIVYSPSTLTELYELTAQAFSVAWENFFPTFILTDGYLCKMMGNVRFSKVKKVKPVAIFEPNSGKYKNVRNCYDHEEELYEIIEKNINDFNKLSPKIAKCEEYPVFKKHSTPFDLLVIAHGIVGSAAKEAVGKAINKGLRVGFFRPITLSPFPKEQLHEMANYSKNILVVESAYGQLAGLIKKNLYGIPKPFIGFYKPALGFEPIEIENKITEILGKKQHRN